MTMRIAFLVAGKRAQSGIPLRSAAAQPGGKSRHEGGLEVAGDRNPRHPGEYEGSEPDEDGCAEASAAAAERPEHQLRRADRAESATGAAADRLVPLPETEPDGDAEAR